MSIRSLLVIIAAITGAQLAAAPRVATTVDFLDYAFFDSLGAVDHYELSAWEQRIRELADAGISKIYLRVNVCGQTLFPTRVSAIYGADGAFHWNEGREARRLIRTLEKYDPLAETIRIGKNMVWKSGPGRIYLTITASSMCRRSRRSSSSAAATLSLRCATPGWLLIRSVTPGGIRR